LAVEGTARLLEKLKDGSADNKRIMRSWTERIQVLRLGGELPFHKRRGKRMREGTNV